ncbi:Phospholipase_D-nuclease N-terminal [Paraoerskovia marina]|uniref:Phospholipase_D-nuclease N-terminal n=1 Tax=Paraoerskovia marina TaxID=545619 RepID=A0A1H1VL59_9CELL|nr:PLD nuclease N-terminal domain-containing protein [Paraoerskovia marina]SDS85016.1 Phospholipase_D-nuclease N-terminal [Paraoerskovia marina]
MARVAIVLVVVGLTVYALTDCIGSEESERNGIPRGLWILMIVILPVLGPVAWLITSRNGRARPAARRGPVAPDDDPDFLWRLRQEERRRKQDGTDASDDAE